MEEATRAFLTKILEADNTVTAEQRETILKATRQPVPRRKLITAKEAQEILGVSRPTLRDYVRRRRLEQINMSCRKVRFDEQEVLRLAYGGSTVR